VATINVCPKKGTKGSKTPLAEIAEANPSQTGLGQARRIQQPAAALGRKPPPPPPQCSHFP